MFYNDLSVEGLWITAVSYKPQLLTHKHSLIFWTFAESLYLGLLASKILIHATVLIAETAKSTL